MASLRDALGFLAPPRAAGLEAPLGARSPHEQPTSCSLLDPAHDKTWQAASKLGLPTLSTSRCPASGGQATKLAPQLSKAQQAALKSLVRRGVPFNVRPAMWLVASGGLAKAQAAPDGQYDRLAASSVTLPSLVVSQVDADVRTVCLTWRQHPLLKTAGGITAMTRILLALLNHSAGMAYSRQLCHMVAFALVVFGGPDQQEQVFWTLAALLQDKLYAYCNGQWQVGSRIESEVLTRLAARKLPRLTAHLSSVRLPLATITQPWLTGLYVSCLPPETLARVWDCMMVEGGKLLLRVGLALLKMYEQTLASCTFPEVLRKVLELRVSRTTDVAALLSAAIKGCGSLPGEQVAALRAEVMKAQGLSFQPTSNSSSPTGLAIPTGFGRSVSARMPAANNGNNGNTVGSAPATGALGAAANSSSGPINHSVLHRSASGPKLLARTSPSGPMAVAGGLGSSSGSPTSSPSRSSNGSGDDRNHHGPTVAIVDTVTEMSEEESKEGSRGSSPGRGGVMVTAMAGTETAMRGTAETTKRSAPSGSSMPPKRASVGAHLSSMIARLGWGGGSSSAAAAPAAAIVTASAVGPVLRGGSNGGASGMPRSATASCVHELAAC